MNDKSDAPLTRQLDLYTPPMSTRAVAILPDDLSTLSQEDDFHPATTNSVHPLSSESYYEGLEEKEIKTLENLAKQIRGKHWNHFKIVYELGHALTKAKFKLKGRFIEWLEKRCELTVRSAQRYMGVYKFALEHVKAHRLPVSVIYECMRPGTPKDAVKELLGGVEDGLPPLAVIAAKLRTARADCRRGAAEKGDLKTEVLASDPAAIVANLIVSCTPRAERLMVGHFFRGATSDDLVRLAENLAARLPAEG